MTAACSHFSPEKDLVLAFCQVFNIKFGYMKVIFDISLVTFSCILSFAFLGHLQGVREGTVVAAVGVGLIARQIDERSKKFRRRFLTEQPWHHTGDADVESIKIRSFKMKSLR